MLMIFFIIRSVRVSFSIPILFIIPHSLKIRKTNRRSPQQQQQKTTAGWRDITGDTIGVHYNVNGFNFHYA